MEDRARTRPVLLLACFVMAFLVLAVFLAWVLVNHGYEDQYLGLGSLVVRGQLSLYQNEMTGQWVPLPFYVYGLSQVIAGPNLLAARLLSVGMGVFVLILIFALSTRWGGLAAGAVASGLFCTHGLVVGYFATAHFASIGALLHLFGIYVLFCTDWPKRDLLGMAVFSLLFLVKPHYWPTIPFVLLFLLWRARNLRSREAGSTGCGVVRKLS